MHPAGFPFPLPQGGSLVAFLIVVAIVIGTFYWQHRRRSRR